MTIIPVSFGGDTVGDALIDEQTNRVTINVTVSKSTLVSIFSDPDESDTGDADPPTLHIALVVKNGKSQVHFF